MSIRNYLQGGVESRIVDENILNVIRRSDAGFVGTTEVVNDDHIDLKYDAVKGRLEDLEDDGRVHSKNVGDPDQGSIAWYLDDSERKRPVDPENYWSAQITGMIRAAGRIWVRGGGIVAVAAMVLLVVSLSTEVFGVPIQPLDPKIAGMWGFKLTLAAFAVVTLGGAVMWGATVTEAVVERNSTPNEQ